jgi:hypothetical protein
MKIPPHRVVAASLAGLTDEKFQIVLSLQVTV